MVTCMCVYIYVYIHTYIYSGSIAHGNTHDCSSEQHNSSNFIQIAKQLGGNTGFQVFPTRLYSEDLITSFLIRARLRVPGYAGSLA